MMPLNAKQKRKRLLFYLNEPL